MEWKLINIWDVVQTKTGVVGIVITKFTDHINLDAGGKAYHLNFINNRSSDNK